jgi:DinB superfamily
MTDESLLDALAATIQTTRRAERDLFGGLDDAARERPIRAGDWNPKDFQAHLTAWKARQADRFAAVREGRELPPPMDDQEEDALNAELRATRIDSDWAPIVDEADAVAERLVDEIRQADPEVLRASDRLMSGTFGNGVLHTVTHVRWLLEAGVPLDRTRVSVFEGEALRDISTPAIPDKARAVGLYDLACYHALSGSPDVARSLLRDAFRLDPDLVGYSHTDAELLSIRDDLDGLAG